MFNNDKLTQLLRGKGITVYRLCKLTGISQPALRRLNKG